MTAKLVPGRAIAGRVMYFLLGAFALVTPSLADQTRPESWLKKIIVLREQADVVSLARDFAASAVPMSVQHRRIAARLQELATRSQAELLPVLDEMKTQGLVAQYVPLYIANCVAVEATAQALAEIERLPVVLRIEDDYQLVLDPEPWEPAPNRNSLDNVETGLRNIRAPEVWEMGITGASVLVSHLDTGVNGNHPALAGKWRGSFGYSSSACWYDLNGSTNFPTDVVGHGSQTMGVICGMAEGDTIGVACGSRYISARLNFSNGSTTAFTALLAFQWMLNPDGNPYTFDDVPRVISNSWGFAAGSVAPCYSIFNQAIDNCEAAGTAVLWAAGNEGPPAGSMRVPADRATSEFNSFAVGAFDHLTNSVWSSSSRGPSSCSSDPAISIKPEVLAPGRSVRSSGLGTSYVTSSGTSFSVAHVAGVIALMLEANSQLSVDSLKEILLFTSVDHGEVSDDNSCGRGQIDALTAVYGALSGIGWISGHVTDPYGNGLAASITLSGHPHTFAADSTGNYTFAMPAEMPLNVTFSTSITIPEVRSVVLTARDTLRLDIVLQPNGNGLLTGMVVSCYGIPAAGASVYTIPMGYGETTTDDGGRFELSLLNGLYSIGADDGVCSPGVVSNVQIFSGGITDIEIVLQNNPAHLCSPPDNYGYRICDNNDPDGPVFEWNEIAPAVGGRGVAHNLSDEGYVAVSLPFPVNFYGNTYEQMFVNANGSISFRDRIFNWVNTALPAGYWPAVYAYWDDLQDDLGGDICSAYDPAHGRYIVEWSGVPRYGGSQPETFEIVIYDPELYETPTGDAVIDVHYGNVPVTDECTVGLDADDGVNYRQYLFNGVYHASASPLAAGRALRFSTGDIAGGMGNLSLLNPDILVDVPPYQWRDTALVLTNDGSAALAYCAQIEGDSVGTYQWSDSRVPGGPAFQFFDIAQIGTDLGMTNDDSTSPPVRLPWFFPFYDRQFDRVAICSNGFISFTSAIKEYVNESMSDLDDPFYYIAPFWDDLLFCGGEILTYNDTPGQRFIVQWNNVKKYGSSCASAPGPFTFQVALYRDGTIELVYGTMGTSPSHRLSATVGMRGRNSTNALQFAYNSAFIENDRLVRIQRPQSQTAICRIWDNPYGVIAPAETVLVPIRLWNNGIWFGSEEWSITVESSDQQRTLTIANIALEYALESFRPRLTIRPVNGAVRLSWKRFAAPFYCIYGGASSDQMDFITSVTDTFCVFPLTNERVRLFEIRLCEGPPGSLAVKPNMETPTAIRKSE